MRVPTFRHHVQPKGRRPVTLREPSWHQLRPHDYTSLLDTLYMEVEDRDFGADWEVHTALCTPAEWEGRSRDLSELMAANGVGLGIWCDAAGVL